MATGYRIHCGSEALDSVIDARRPDGWAASDEGEESQPLGVSCCSTLGALARYARLYSMAVQNGDVVLELTGAMGDCDRDENAIRLVVESYRAVATGADFRAAHAAWRRCLDVLRGEPEDEEDWGTVLAGDDRPAVRALVAAMLEG